MASGGRLPKSEALFDRLVVGLDVIVETEAEFQIGDGGKGLINWSGGGKAIEVTTGLRTSAVPTLSLIPSALV